MYEENRKENIDYKEIKKLSMTGNMTRKEYVKCWKEKERNCTLNWGMDELVSALMYKCEKFLA